MPFTRDWTSATISGAYNADNTWNGVYKAGAWIAIIVPASVVLTGMHWNNLHTPQAPAPNGTVRPGTNREVNWIWANGDGGSIGGQFGTVYSGDTRVVAFNNQGDGSTYWGIVARGGGWSVKSDPKFMLDVDAFWLTGTETYYQNVYHIDTARLENSYW